MEQLLAQVFRRLSEPALPNEAAVRQSLFHLDDERPDLCNEYAEPLGDSGWPSTNCSNGEKKKMLEDVKKTASGMGLQFDFGVGGGG